MAYIILKYLLFISGLAVTVISTSIIFFGPQAVAMQGAIMSDVIMGQTNLKFDFTEISTDSELRFYSAFFFAYGLLILQIASDLRNRMHLVPILAGVMILGCVARMVSIYMVGLPHPLFILLGMIEFFVPAIVMFLYQRVKRAQF